MDGFLAAASTVMTQILPTLVNLFLSAGNFNRSVMVRAMEANQELCPDYKNQKNHKDANNQLDPFPCLRPGLAALAICQGTTAMAISLFISSYVSSNGWLRLSEFLIALFLFFAMLMFLVSFKNEIFKIEEWLPKSRYHWARWVGAHVGVTAGLLVFIFSIITSISALIHIGLP
jgi:uncharacterized membrane protein